VWRAIADAGEFAKWFGVTLQGEFKPGARMQGVFDGGGPPQDVIDSIAKKVGLEPGPIKAPERDAVFCVVERMEPEHHFAFRWIPYGIDAAADAKNEPMTLVEFHLEKKGEKETSLTITESGFEKVPAHRRRRAFLMNGHGWAAQAENVRKYVEQG
jgi:uncharacterized protein YndB with AHSA1/START domain